MNPTELIQVINTVLDVDITEVTRKRKTVYARFIFYNKLKYSNKYYLLQEIANYVGKDHSSVIHGLRQYDMLKDYEDFKKIIKKVEKEIERNGNYQPINCFTNYFGIRRYNETI